MNSEIKYFVAPIYSMHGICVSKVRIKKRGQSGMFRCEFQEGCKGTFNTSGEYLFDTVKDALNKLEINVEDHIRNVRDLLIAEQEKHNG